MKCRVAQAVLIAVLAGMFLPGLAQKNYYVVVGAFSTEGNAKELTTYLPSLNADTAYAMNEQEHVVHLYVMRTTSEEVAVAKSQFLQSSLEGPNGSTANHESVLVSKLPENRSVTVTKTIEPMTSGSVSSDASSPRGTTPVDAGIVTAPASPKGKLFKFTISDPTGQTIPGRVHFVDLEMERDLASYNSDAYTNILNPGEEKNIAVVFGTFGYRQSEKFIDYADPSLIEGAYQDENGAWVIPYKLERLQKGDVSVMYNVAFYHDAAVLIPQSRTDLDELVTMMNENPDYEITIHGHCNGKNDRNITRATDCFDITNSRQFFGSAKELSTLRATAIRDYVVSKGINSRRIRTFAWGGRYHLVDPHGSNARLNDRIEIEIRKD
jgi:outer membrane protein OmpA-like peptidoglycan-associated protein